MQKSTELSDLRARKIGRQLTTYARLARQILVDGTPYISAKSLISAVFETRSKARYVEEIKLRLTVVDSYYSTNMGKRYYGIDELADTLSTLGRSDNEILHEAFSLLIAKPGTADGGALSGLFSRPFGLTKKGKPAGRAASLLSKYLYFLTKYRFPIYDRLAVKSLQLLSRRYADLSIGTFTAGDPLAFFQALIVLNQYVGDIDTLDNLLWLLGKVREGNLSLVLSRKRFEELGSHGLLPTTAASIIEASRSSAAFRSIVGGGLCRFISFGGGLV